MAANSIPNSEKTFCLLFPLVSYRAVLLPFGRPPGTRDLCAVGRGAGGGEGPDHLGRRGGAGDDEERAEGKPLSGAWNQQLTDQEEG